jgi:hypothetical protein
MFMPDRSICALLFLRPILIFRVFAYLALCFLFVMAPFLSFYGMYKVTIDSPSFQPSCAPVLSFVLFSLPSLSSHIPPPPSNVFSADPGRFFTLQILPPLARKHTSRPRLKLLRHGFIWSRAEFEDSDDRPTNAECGK